MTMERSSLDRNIAQATKALLDCQQADGHWVFELEADATIPAEYVLLRHYLAEPVDPELERKIAIYLRRVQGAHGGWPLFHDGAFDMSASVKAYFALKTIGDSIDAPHMARAREAIRARGGAERSNVFTKLLLALFGFIPWRAVPAMPVEIMLLPKWFPFHLDKISYWSRTVIVPLLVLMAKKPRARNPKGVRIDELFVDPPDRLGPAPKAPQQNAGWFAFFRAVDAVLHAGEPLFPRRMRQRAIDRAVRVGRGAAQRRGRARRDLSGDGQQRDDVRRARLSAQSHPQRAIARKSVEKLLVVHPHEAYCQPCVSPIWDTGLVCHALLEAGDAEAQSRVAKGSNGSCPQQILDVRGDWVGAAARPAARRLGVPVRQSALPRRRRHRGGGDGDGSRAERRSSASTTSCDRARARVDRRHAEQERRLGRVRRRQRILLSQPHSVRRPRRAARSADRRRDRALRVDAGAARRDARRTRRLSRRPSTTCGARSMRTEAGSAAGA